MPSFSGKGTAQVTLGKYVAPTHDAPATPVAERSLTALDYPVIELHNPVQSDLARFVQANRDWPDLDLIQANERKGHSLAICGAGPSLRGATDHRFGDVSDVWAVNSALPYLISQGVHVTAAFGIDQTPGLLREWITAPEVVYYVASSCDPTLIAHLRLNGRTVRFFHNQVGIAASGNDELLQYATEWPQHSIMLGAGFSASSRAIGLATWMGYDAVELHGVDCCFADDHGGDLAHANGESANEAYREPVISQGSIDGVTYRTRGDMLLDAVHLAQRVRDSKGRLTLVGEKASCLPLALLDKSDAFLDMVAMRGPADEILKTKLAHDVSRRALGNEAFLRTLINESSRAPLEAA